MKRDWTDTVLRVLFITALVLLVVLAFSAGRDVRAHGCGFEIHYGGDHGPL